MKKLFLVSAMITFSIACFPQKGKWKKALNINTIESYQDFLVNYPKSEFSDVAINNIMELEYKKAKEINSIDGYEKFIQKYPEGKYVVRVNTTLDSLGFASAQVINTWEKYEEYIYKFGENALYYDIANEKAEALLHQELISNSTISLCEHFLDSYPKSINQYEISTTLIDLKEKKIQQDIELYFEETSELLNKRSYAKAIASLDKVIELDNFNTRALIWRGDIKYYEKDYQGSINDYTQVIRLTDNDTTLVNSYFKIAQSMLELENNNQALLKANEMVKSKPKFSQSYYYRAYIKYKVGDKQGALTDINKSIQLNPFVAEAYSMRGVFKSELNDDIGAIKDFRKVVEINPKIRFNKEILEKYKTSIYYKKESYIGTIVSITQSFGASEFGVSPGGFTFWLEEYKDIGFDIDQETSKTWGLVSIDKDNPLELKFVSKGWKVKFTTTNAISTQSLKQDDPITKKAISCIKLK